MATTADSLSSPQITGGGESINSILLPHFDAIDMKFGSQIIDMYFDACRRPTPVTKLLPSNETIQGECTSRETIFSNQVIAAGTSKSSRQGPIHLGKISSSLECWPEHGPYLQVSLSLSLSYTTTTINQYY